MSILISDSDESKSSSNEGVSASDLDEKIPLPLVPEDSSLSKQFDKLKSPSKAVPGKPSENEIKSKLRLDELLDESSDDTSDESDEEAMAKAGSGKKKRIRKPLAWEDFIGKNVSLLFAFT